MFVGIAALVIVTQMGRHAIGPRRFLLPILAVGFAGYHYLQSIPTAGGDLDFELICTLAGIGFGLLAASLVRVDRDATTGRLMMEAGVAYAAVWVTVFGCRLAFAWLATHVWNHQIAQFSVQHAITSGAAWTAAFVLMALAMVVARTAALGIRTALVANQTRTQYA
jgi:hypothetical protein